jgi:hypothetical protein
MRSSAPDDPFLFNRGVFGRRAVASAAQTATCWSQAGHPLPSLAAF